MKNALLQLVALASLVAGCSTDSPPEAGPIASAPFDASAVQADVQALSDAVWAGDVDVVLQFADPRMLASMGGLERARPLLEQALKQPRSLGLSVEAFVFPAPPSFASSAAHDYVIVPTLTTIGSGGQLADSLGYQLGSRPRGSTAWTYTDGSQINTESLGVLFPDFPPELTLPETYRKKR